MAVIGEGERVVGARSGHDGDHQRGAGDVRDSRDLRQLLRESPENVDTSRQA